MDALAVVTTTGVEIWTGNQSPDIAMSEIADATGFKREQVRIHNQMLGGGFGRRIMPDYLVEAARVAQLSGKPVRVVWSREDDMRGDFYRPNSTVAMSAMIDSATVTSLQGRIVAPSIVGSFVPVPYTHLTLPTIRVVWVLVVARAVQKNTTACTPTLI